MNLEEYFTSISKVESYLYEWYFHLLSRTLKDIIPVINKVLKT